MLSFFDLIASLSASKQFYLGPETVLPIASILAGIVGVILMFWRVIFGFVKRFFRFILRKMGRLPDPEPVEIEESENPAELQE